MPSVTVWFDGSCPLCTREVALLRRLDRRRAIGFIDIADEGSYCPLDPAEMLARFHAQEDGGPLVSGAPAFAAIWRAIPLLRPFGLAARSPFVLCQVERAYVWFLRRRPRSPAQMAIPKQT